MGQQPEGFVPDGFEPDGFEPEDASAPSMNFATVNGQRVPVDDGPSAAVGEFVKTANPIPGIASVGKAVMSGAKVFGGIGSGDVNAIREGTSELGDIGHGILAAQNHVKEGADAAWAAGDYKTALRKYADWLLPLIGPQMDEQADNLASGQYWKAAGGLAGLGTVLAGPELLSRARMPSVKVLPAIASRTANPVEAAAVRFGEQQGIPMDAGTVTGSPAVRNMQKRLEGTIGGAAPTQAFQAAKDAGLTRTGQELADQIHPTSATPLSAGDALRSSVQSRIRDLNTAADQAYSQVRALEQANPDVMAVNVAATKAGMQSVYESLLRESELVPLQGGKAKALTALDRLMKGPDVVPLSTAERALSDFKALSRGNEAMPELRSGGQGIAGKAVGELQSQVDAAATKGGPSVRDALTKGRAATREKYAVADVLDAMNQKDVSAFDQATAGRDTNVAHLRELQKVAPQALPQVARAWLERALDTATQEGTFAHTDKLYADWQRLGDETKQVLYGAKMTADLDNFFKLAKDLGKNPNPSGTANVLGFNTAQALAYLPTKALTKILYSPDAIKLLTQGLKIGGRPGGVMVKSAARVAGVGGVLREVGAGSRTVPVVEDDTDTTRRAPQPSR